MSPLCRVAVATVAVSLVGAAVNVGLAALLSLRDGIRAKARRKKLEAKS